METSLVILGCTERKNPSPGLIPAIDRYDGPSVRVLRRFVRESSARPVRACFVSGRYGLVRDDFPLPVYDHRLLPEDENRLTLQVGQELKRAIADFDPSRFFVSVSGGYWRLLRVALAREVPSDRLAFARGAVGGRASRLFTWLRSNCGHDAPRTRRPLAGEATLLGTTLKLSSAEFCRRVREALAATPQAAERFETWYVPFDGRRVAAKWLVSVLFQKPVARFRTADARRVLTCLGIETRYADR